MTIYYNSKDNSFYDSDISDIPEDSIEISADLHRELFKKQSQGFIIKSDEKGNPVAMERILTKDEIKNVNESILSRLMNEANQQITLLQDAIDLDMAEKNDEVNLKMWKKYRVLLNKVDISIENLKLPEKPSQ